MSTRQTLERQADEADLARSFDLFALPPDYFDAPHVWHRRLRLHDPVHQNADGSVLLTRYGDVRAVWRDLTASVDKTEMFRKKFGEGPLLEHHTTAMLFRDPPGHDRLRAIVEPFFGSESVERFRPFLLDLIDRLLDEAEEMRRLDFVSDFAAKIPIAVITRILGVPPEDGDMLRQIGLRVLFPLNPRVPDEAIAAGHAAAAEWVEYLGEHLRRVRRSYDGGEPDTLIEALVAAERSGTEISEPEILHTCMLVLNGGHETTTNLMSGSVNALLDHPSQLDELVREGDVIAQSAVEECIRYVSPLQLQGRRTTVDLSIPSRDLPAGTEVILCQASANRDADVFAEPDTLLLRRPRNAHLAFGLGLHLCIGRPLARMEATILLPRLAQRFPGLSRAGEPVWNPNARFRGLKSLPVSTK